MRTITVIGHVAGIIYQGHEWLASETGMEAGGMSQLQGKKGHTAEVYKTKELAEEREKLLKEQWPGKETFTREYTHETFSKTSV